MTLKELEIILEEKFVIENINVESEDKFVASFPRVEIMRSGCLTATCGFGKTVKEAKRGLCKQMQKQRVVLSACRSSRKEIQLPPMITC